MPPNHPLLLWHLSCGYTRCSQFLFLRSFLRATGFWSIVLAQKQTTDGWSLSKVTWEKGSVKTALKYSVTSFTHTIGFHFVSCVCELLRLLWNNSMCRKTEIQILVIEEEAHKGVVNHGNLNSKWQDNRDTGTGRGSVGFGSGTQLAEGWRSSRSFGRMETTGKHCWITHMQDSFLCTIVVLFSN